MSDEEFLIVLAWVNEVLTLPGKTINTARQSRSTMNGTIHHLSTPQRRQHTGSAAQ